MSGNISLPYYPSTNRTFGFFADIDGSQANTALFQQRALIIGQMLSGGTAAAGTAYLVESLLQVAQLTGLGSMIYEMVKQYRSQDSFGELWILPLADPTGTPATGTRTLAGTATAAGTLSDYFGGELVTTPVAVGDTAAALATRRLALMGASLSPDLPVTATVAGAVTTVTAKHVGLLGNDIDLRSDYLGAPGGENPVAGITETIVAMSGGAGSPATLSTVLAALGDQTFDFIACPYTDTASLGALDAFLSESNGSGRWSWQEMLFGGYFTASRGSAGTLATFGTARNGKFGSCLMVLPDEPDPVWIHAADYCANAAVSLRADPGVPLQNIVLGTKCPASRIGLSRSLRNTLLYDGISTKTVNHAAQNVLERAVTFYQTNAAGAPDNSFLDVETIYGLAYLIRSWQDRMLTLFPRKKLVMDGTSIPAGSSLVSPSTIKFATISWYSEQCDNGYAQDLAGFKAAITAQNAGNGLVKELLPFILVNQLRQIAALAQFTKP